MKLKRNEIETKARKVNYFELKEEFLLLRRRVCLVKIKNKKYNKINKKVKMLQNTF